MYLKSRLQSYPAFPPHTPFKHGLGSPSFTHTRAPFINRSRDCHSHEKFTLWRCAKCVHVVMQHSHLHNRSFPVQVCHMSFTFDHDENSLHFLLFLLLSSRLLLSKLLTKFSDANTMFPLKRTQKGRSMGGDSIYTYMYIDTHLLSCRRTPC